jgi:hypothetical protein
MEAAPAWAHRRRHGRSGAGLAQRRQVDPQPGGVRRRGRRAGAGVWDRPVSKPIRQSMSESSAGWPVEPLALAALE